MSEALIDRLAESLEAQILARVEARLLERLGGSKAERVPANRAKGRGRPGARVAYRRTAPDWMTDSTAPMDVSARKVFDALEGGQWTTRRVLASRLGWAPGSLSNPVRALLGAGLIERMEL